MAHRIDVSTGKAAVMVAGVPAWHGLGVNVAGAQTSAEAIRLAGLDWTAERWPLVAYGPKDDVAITVPDQYAIVRTDTNAVLGTVGSNYRVFQNREAFNFLDAVVGEKLATYETAGAIDGGRSVWMLCPIPREIRASSEDVVKPYVLLTNTHDGTRALRAFATSIRVVCWNTLTLAMVRAAGGDGLTVRHMPGLDDRVKEARRVVGLIVDRIDAHAEEIKKLVATKMTQATLDKYFGTLYPKELRPESKAIVGAPYAATEQQAKKNADIQIDLVQRFLGERQVLKGIKGTAWAAFNAVTEMVDHGPSRRNAESAFKHVMLGTGRIEKERAFELALTLTV